MLSACIIQPAITPLPLVASGEKRRITYIGVGLSRCSFRLAGQCESLDAWDGQ